MDRSPIPKGLVGVDVRRRGLRPTPGISTATSAHADLRPLGTLGDTGVLHGFTAVIRRNERMMGVVNFCSAGSRIKCPRLMPSFSFFCFFQDLLYEYHGIPTVYMYIFKYTIILLLYFLIIFFDKINILILTKYQPLEIKK